MKNIITYLWLLVISVCLFSCKDMDHAYKDFIVPNGITYPGAAKKPVVCPGRNRVQLVWLRGNDPKVVKATVYWNNYTDSLANIPVNSDTISCSIQPLTENNYTFVIKTYDIADNVSIPVEVTGKVYGEIYEKSLQSRRIKSKVFDGKVLTLEWDVANKTDLGVNMTYTDIYDEIHTITVGSSESVTLLPDFNADKPLLYYSMFKPDNMAIDMFHAPQVSTMIDPNISLAKNTWVAYPLPGDIAMYSDNATNPGGQYPLKNIWDNSTGNFCHTAESTTLPIMVSWDLGIKTILSRMKLWPRTHATDNFSQSCPQDFEIWGSLEPNPDGSLDDTWTLLGTFKCIKPSGQLGAGTAIDQAAALAGIDFEFVNPDVTVRYVRLRALSTFASPGQKHRMLLAEISFWGRLMN